jgi:hypothetical protein
MGLLQINDPDPTYWVIVYGLTALAPQRILLGHYFRPFAWVCAGMIISGLIQSGPGFLNFVIIGEYTALTQTMSPNQPLIESAREFIGLVLCAGCVGTYLRLNNDLP